MSSPSAGPPGRSANIFINYRREDSAGHSGRLFDGLSSHFPGRLFMDVDTIAPGIDFVEAIEKAVGACEVLIVVIGQDWLSLENAAGQRRLDDPGDFVRLELETALARNIRVIPVLVQDAPMPRAEALPPSLARLARRNAIELSDARWAYDVDRLVQTIQGVLVEETPSPAPAAAGKATRPRAWLLPFAALVLVAASVLATAGWLSRRPSAPPAVSPAKDNVLPIAPRPANPGHDGLAKLAGRPPATAETKTPVATRPSGLEAVHADPAPVKKLAPRQPVAEPAENPIAADRTGSRSAIQNPVPTKEVVKVRITSEEAGSPTAVDSSPAEPSQLPEVTITAPKNGTKVGKRFTGKGVITGLGTGQRAFLCMKNRKAVTYVRGELFPSSEGQWSLEAESSHDDFEFFVVVSTAPAAAEILSDRGNQEHGFRSFPPKGASIIGPVVSLNRQGKVADLLKRN